jgi:hypothetical protein
MNDDAERDALLRRKAGVALDHAGDRAAHGVDHAAEFDNCTVTGALDHPAVMHDDYGID